MSSVNYKPSKLKELDNYLDTLLHLLDQNKREKRVNIVVLEMVKSYAALTSLLTEQGSVDRVLFTLPDQGYLFNPDDFKDFKGNNIFFGGGYNGFCLAQSINELKGVLRLKNIKAITDLVINHPYIEKLIPNDIHGMEKEDTITLEEASQLFGFPN